MTTGPGRACQPLELRSGGVERVALTGAIELEVVVENETHRALSARVSVDPETRTVTVVVGEGARAAGPRHGA